MAFESLFVSKFYKTHNSYFRINMRMRPDARTPVSYEKPFSGTHRWGVQPHHVVSAHTHTHIHEEPSWFFHDSYPSKFESRHLRPMPVPGMVTLRKFDTPRHYIHSNARDNPGYAGCMIETEVRMILCSKPHPPPESLPPHQWPPIYFSFLQFIFLLGLCPLFFFSFGLVSAFFFLQI